MMSWRRRDEMSQLTEQIWPYLDELLHETKTSIVLAISGGVDSMVLLHLVISYCQDRSISTNRFVLAHFNHQFREASQQEAEALKKIASSYHLLYFVGENQNTEQSEGSARQERYRFFADVLKATDSCCLLTAHHQNDQAETIAMRFIRGSSLKGLRGIQPKRNVYLKTSTDETVLCQLHRPLLQIPKTDLQYYATEHALLYFEDESNQNRPYFRNRMRQEIMPQWLEENPRVIETITGFGFDLTLSYQAHYEWYQQMEPQILLKHPVIGWVLDIEEFKHLSKAHRYIFLMLLFQERLVHDIPDYRRDNVQQLLKIMEQTDAPNQSIDLGNGYQAQREYQTLYITKPQNLIENKGVNALQVNQVDVWYPLNETERVGVFTSNISKGDKHKQLVMGLTIEELESHPFILRHRLPGDRMALQTGTGDVFHKKISRWMIDEKMPKSERDNRWLVIYQDEVLALLPNVIASHSMITDLQHASLYFIYQDQS